MVEDFPRAGTIACDATALVVRLTVAPMFATTLTIPTRQLHEFTRRMSQAGYTVVDTGTRVTTDDGPESEATVRLLHMQIVELTDPAHCELGVSA